MFTIQYAESVSNDLAELRAFEREQILDRIEEQLTHQPTQEMRNKKMLRGLTAPWEHVEPIWELRVGEYRVFYDVEPSANQVTIRAVRHKPPHKTVEQIL